MSVIPLQPIGAVVVVIPHASAKPETPSGIILADVQHDVETSGTVVAVGSGFLCAGCACEREDPVNIGDRVLFGRGSGSEIDGAPLGLVGETFLLLQETELLAVLAAEVEAEVL